MSESGQPEKAMAIYEKALAADPYRWAAANNLAFLMADNPASATDLDRALELAQQAQRQRPEDPVVLDTLGWVHYKRGDMESATALLTHAVEKAPDNGALNYHLGQVLFDSNRLEDAREKLEAAMADDKDFAGKAAAKALLEKIKAGG
jgi:tetratricopeptide (TPR) repeat protein